MSALEEGLGGFCFNCAVSNPNQAFLQTQLPYNPWPILIRSEALDYTRSQPLIRTMYSATPIALLEKIEQRRQHHISKKKPNSEDIKDFYDWYVILHEYAHLIYLYWTPAKEAAKLFLSISYHCLDELLLASAAEGIERNWKRFVNSTKILGRVEKEVGFVEELMATAMSINAMELQTLPGGMWTGFQEELATLKRIALANEEKSFPEFRAAYKRTEPVIKLMYGDLQLMRAMLPLLQPIIKVKNLEHDALLAPLDDDVLETFEAYRTLDVTSQIILLEHTDPASQRLEELMTEGWEGMNWSVWREGWKAALTLQMDMIRDAESENNNNKSHPGNWMRLFLNLAQNNFERQEADLGIPVEQSDQVRRMLQDLYNKFDAFAGSFMTLQRTARGAHSFIGMYPIELRDTPVPPDVRANHVELLLCEAIRQQILARKGFVCALYKGQQHCQCKQGVRKMYQRLYDLASDGLFGRGDWSLPPCFLKR